jgi:serine/threonine protein kinase
MAAATQFGNYVLEERLAVGGMAEVFRARRVGAAGFSRPVCIKRILSQFCEDRAFVEMFIDEANIGAQLRHGNIVAIDDFGQIDKQYYLAMELIHGVDVARLIVALAQDGRALPWQVAAFILYEVLGALDYAHRKKAPDGGPLHVVHRDVSPHNVLISYAGEVKLTDFGIARARTRIHQTTQHVVKGKLAYMAPEQAKALELDGRADLFAVGVSAFEWLCNQRPFVGKTEPEVISNLLRGHRLEVVSLRPDVPEQLVKVLDGLLQPDRNQRTSSASDALASLEPLVLATSARWLSSIVAHYFAGGALTAARPMEGFSIDELPSSPPGGPIAKRPAPVSPQVTQAPVVAQPRHSERPVPPPRVSISPAKQQASQPVESSVATQISQAAPLLELARSAELQAIDPHPMHDGQTQVSAVIEAISSDPQSHVAEHLPSASALSAPSAAVSAEAATLATTSVPSDPRQIPTQTTMLAADEPASIEPPSATKLTQAVARIAQSTPSQDTDDLRNRVDTQEPQQRPVDRSARTQTTARAATAEPLVPHAVDAHHAQPRGHTDPARSQPSADSAAKTQTKRSDTRFAPWAMALIVAALFALAVVLGLILGGRS